LKKVTKLADANIEILKPWIDKKIPVVGIEPSAILSLRDEYKDLCSEENMENAEALTRFVYIIDEFICQQLDQDKIDRKIFKSEKQKIYLHGHCHQKALSSVNYTLKMLSIPRGFEVKEIDCGCCGMAGSFGYEKEHYELSMAIGELKLFPAIRAAEPDAVISATGTSCRHQILDGTGKIALHPVDILWSAIEQQ
jgi:Fe-S oxidoreductase